MKVFLGTLVSVVGLLVLASIDWSPLGFLEEINWSKATGTVVDSNCSKAQGQNVFQPEIEYQYQIDGVDYNSAVVSRSFGAFGFQSQLSCESYLSTIIDSNKNVVLRYDPKDPQLSTLQIQATPLYFAKLIGSLLFGLAFLFDGCRTIKKGSTDFLSQNREGQN